MVQIKNQKFHRNSRKNLLAAKPGASRRYRSVYSVIAQRSSFALLIGLYYQQMTLFAKKFIARVENFIVFKNTEADIDTNIKIMRVSCQVFQNSKIKKILI